MLVPLPRSLVCTKLEDTACRCKCAPRLPDSLRGIVGALGARREQARRGEVSNAALVYRAACARLVLLARGSSGTPGVGGVVVELVVVVVHEEEEEEEEVKEEEEEEEVEEELEQEEHRSDDYWRATSGREGDRWSACNSSSFTGFNR